MNHSPKKNPFHAFQHEFNTFSTCLQQLFAAFRYSLFFFVFSRKSLYFLNKPNPKGILSQCRYTDIKPCSSLKPSAPKNKPSQTVPLFLRSLRPGIQREPLDFSLSIIA
jgi:hypothetical protein